MCGIFFLLSRHHQIQPSLERTREANKRRGPDSSSSTHLTASNYQLLFEGSVLWLQGGEPVPQPLITDSSVFLFNGDIFTFGDKDQGTDKSNDTLLFLDALERSSDLIETLSSLQGPYSFVYFDKKEEKVYFGRDLYGRRSLLIGKSGDDIVVTSVSERRSGCDFIELPAAGIFSFDLRCGSFELLLYKQQSHLCDKISDIEKFLSGRMSIIKRDESVTRPKRGYIEPTERDLEMYKKIRDLSLGEAFEELSKSEEWDLRLSLLETLLEDAIKKRVTTQPSYCKNCIETRTPCHHPLTGLLFSGGIDCTILALLIDKHTPPERSIDLLNVAFNKTTTTTTTYLTPDRITSRESLQELRTLRPDRHWNLIEIDVPQAELDLERTDRIADLIYPRNTVLDESLGCALWFASRGADASPCRVVVSGIGADELFGGYTRHRTVLKRRGWEGLHGALEEEIANIPYRNLGRDDRVVSDHGRQLRMPYLDEEVVGFATRLNCWERTCPVGFLEQGVGEKILLRVLGYRLGLRRACGFKKRALQFGCRIADSKENGADVSKRLLI